MRILIGECKQETSSFNPRLTEYEDFAVEFGEEILSYHRRVRNEVGGALAVFDDRLKRLQAAGGSTASALNFRIFEAFRSVMLRQRDALELYDTFINFPDPEGLYYMGRGYAHIGALEESLALIDKSERGGFFCYPFFVRDPWLDPLRGDARLNDIIRRAESQWRDAKRAFESHPGSRVLTIGAK